MQRVLLVDDEPIFRMGLRVGIPWEELGCTVIGEAKNGEEALIQIEEKKPDIVFLDIKMPKVDGIEVLRRRKGNTANPHFIMLSCFDEYEYVREAMKLGAKDYLFKPLMESKDIADAVREICETQKEERIENQENENQIRELFEKVLESLSESTATRGAEKELETLGRLCPAMSGQGYFAAAIKLPDRKCSAEKRRNLFALVRGVLMQCADCGEKPVFAERGRELHCIFCCDEEIWDTLVTRKLLWKKLRDYVEVPLWAACSSWKKGIEQLPDALHEADKALQVGFFKAGKTGSGQEWLVYRPKYEESFEFEHIFAEEVEQAEQAIQEGALLKVWSVLDQICEKIQADELFQERDFSYLLAVMIIKYARKNRQNLILEDLLREDYDAISNLYHQETQEEACDYFMKLLERIVPSKENERSRVADTARMQLALDWLGEHFTEHISLQEIAGRAHVSPKYFCKRFKETTGKTFVSYLNELRINQAKQMLRETELGIAEVAEHCGFTDYRHFCKTFKKLTGRTPTELRTSG